MHSESNKNAIEPLGNAFTLKLMIGAASHTLFYDGNNNFLLLKEESSITMQNYIAHVISC